MRPAYSVILLTTLIGAGQGLLFGLVGADLATVLGAVEPEPARRFVLAGCALSLALTGAGLAASFWHLGHPERAWRAASCWRTSWLSREVIALPLFMAALTTYGLAHWAAPASVSGRALWTALWTGLAAAALAVALYVCTGMVYASVKVIREWASALTVVNYTLLGTASGLTPSLVRGTGRRVLWLRTAVGGSSR